MFSHRLQDIAELEAMIRQEVGNIIKDILPGVMDSFHSRLQHCTANRNAHLMEIIFFKLIFFSIQWCNNGFEFFKHAVFIYIIFLLHFQNRSLQMLHPV